MSDNKALRLIKFVLLTAVIALAPLIVARYILHNHAVEHGLEEMRSSAMRYVVRAETMFGNAVIYLRRLDHDKAVTCLPEHRQAFRDFVRADSFISEMGLVDRDGNPMCIEPYNVGATQILPAADDNSPKISMGLMDDEIPGVRAAVVSWHLGNGVRLIAKLTSTAAALEAGPDYLMGFRRVEVGLSSGQLWLSEGQLPDNLTLDDEVITEIVQSSRFPITVRVSAPKSALLSIVSQLVLLATIVAAFFGLIFMLLTAWSIWRPLETDEFVRAITNEEFVPFYQPVMDISTGSLRGCEVLMRWKTKNGIVSPGSFMPYAEASGHIFEITRQLMRKVVLDVGDLHAEFPDIKLSINLFAGHFDNREVIEDINEIFGDTGISFDQLMLEVTERQPLRDMDMARKIIAELRSMGAKIALDDAGTGHGGLAYLQDLGFDVIKIDKMFIDRLGHDNSSTAIVDSLVELASSLDMGIIAEGVENKDQVERLRMMGVTAAQGYIFAPALPADSYIDLAKSIAIGSRLPNMDGILETETIQEEAEVPTETGIDDMSLNEIRSELDAA